MAQDRKNPIIAERVDELNRKHFRAYVYTVARVNTCDVHILTEASDTRGRDGRIIFAGKGGDLAGFIEQALAARS